MNRPSHIWMVFGICLVLLLSAMGWVTWHTLRLERERQATAAEAQKQERLRLALWRLDFQASTLVIRENARPPQDFRSFHAPEGFFGKDNRELKKGDVLAPSPLLGLPPELVVLYFQFDTQGRTTSPQVPEGPLRKLALDNYLEARELELAEAKLKTIRELLAKPGSATQVGMAQAPEGHAQVIPSLNAGRPSLTNGQALCAWNSLPPISTSSLPGGVMNPVAPPSSAPAPANAPVTPQGIQVTQAENIVRNRAVEAQKLETLPQQLSVKGKAGSQAVPPVGKQMRRPLPATPQVADTEVGAAPATPPLSFDDDAVATLTASAAKPLQGFWIENTLLLTREASVDGVRMFQGVWIDWSKLSEQWLAQVRDLFPKATLSPASNVLPGQSVPEDPLRLASLPVRLVTGPLSPNSVLTWTPLRSSLVIAWLCVGLAAAAVGLVLHGTVSLSERRAAFVSAVTHELRTPLTTFRLYSEMLASGMVREEEQQRTYLGTLEAEAARLSHLVENVLAYARIEKGSARAQVEKASIGDILDRTLPRLKQRADQAGMEIVVEADEADRKKLLRVDVSALEQILFNLVDNACKYAAPRASEKTIHLQAVTRGPLAMLRVRDHGAGISPGERKRVFRAFHKSADQAAHSAPGVGLGLALCERLSRELGGRLSLEKLPDTGASFVLELPTVG